MWIRLLFCLLIVSGMSGCQMLDMKKDGGDVDAITASTITSRAFTDAVKLAHDIFKQIDKEE